MKKIMKKHVRKFDGKSIKNLMVSEGSEPRLVLYCCVIIHIGYLRKREKIRGKIDAKTT